MYGVSSSEGMEALVSGFRLNTDTKVPEVAAGGGDCLDLRGLSAAPTVRMTRLPSIFTA